MFRLRCGCKGAAAPERRQAMGMFDSALKGLTFGAGLGLGYVLVSRALFPGSRDASKPFAKAAIRSYLELTDKYSEFAAELREQFADLIAEVKAEREACGEEAAAGRQAEPNGGSDD